MNEWIRGDRLLVDQLRSAAQAHDARHLMSRVARCWDRFGLPDGSKNPGRRRTDGWSFGLMPTESMIHDAMNTLLGAVLAKRDQWLLDIPRVLLPDRSGAEILVSRRSAAMGLPWSAFGGLFYVNFLYLVLVLDDRADTALSQEVGVQRAMKITSQLLKRIPPDLCRHALTHWMTGCAVGPEAKPAVHRLEAALNLAMKVSDNQGDRVSIWAVTTFQQAIMVIHEFGHIVALRDAHVQHATKEHSIAEELRADRWGLNSNRRLAHRLFGATETGSEAVARSLLSLYSVLEFIEYPDPRDPRREDMAIRCAAYIHELATESPFAKKIDEAWAFSFFEKMREAFAERLPAKFWFVMFDKLAQHLKATAQTSYDNDDLRKTWELAWEPWGLG